MKNKSNILWGIVLIVIGIIWGINSLGIVHINIFFKGWWTLFIIIPSIIGIVKNVREFSNYVWLLLGVVLLLCTRGILSFELIRKLLLPAILVIVGISFIFKNITSEKISKKMKNIDTDGMEIYVASFSENKVKLVGDEFKNANLDSTFGNIKFDISQCNIDEDKIIKASAIFAGVEIIVPQNVNVRVKSTNIFGGTSNKIKDNKSDEKHTVYIESFAMFGGVTIR